MRLPNFLMILIAGILLAGCMTSTSYFAHSDCPPDTIQLKDEHSGNYDCVTQQEYDELLRALEEADETHRALSERG